MDREARYTDELTKLHFKAFQKDEKVFLSPSLPIDAEKDTSDDPLLSLSIYLRPHKT